MPLYDVSCPVHGVTEVFRPMRSAEPWTCAHGCTEGVDRTFSPADLGGVRVEDYENVGAERGGDCAGEFITLPEIREPLGRDASGRERFAYRAPNVGDIRSRREFLEAAKRAGLTPGDSGRFRTVGQKR